MLVLCLAIVAGAILAVVLAFVWLVDHAADEVKQDQPRSSSHIDIMPTSLPLVSFLE
jgi:hypothetical protein